MKSGDFQQDLYNFQKPSDRVVNEFLFETEPLQHFDEEYQSKLIKKQQFSDFRSQEQQYQKIVNRLPLDKPLNPHGELCQRCYEELNRNKKWCRVCGCYVCRQCFVRKRKMVNGEVVDYCFECDNAFLEAMNYKLTLDRYNILNQAFLKLAEEQQMMEKLLAIQKKKEFHSPQISGQDDKKQKQLEQILNESLVQNKNLKSEIVEFKRKIEWGTNLTQQLKNKKRKARRLHSLSFTSIPDDTLNISPPKVDVQSSLSIDNINESLVTTLLERQQQEEEKIIEPKKCNFSECQLL